MNTTTKPPFEFFAGSGRLGNKLFQAAIGLLIARENCRNIAIDFGPHSPGNSHYHEHILPFFFNPIDIDYSIGCTAANRSLAGGVRMSEAPQQASTAAYIRDNLYHVIKKDFDAEEAGIFIHYRIGDLAEIDKLTEENMTFAFHPPLAKKPVVANIKYMESAIKSIRNYEDLPKYISSDSPEDERVRKICRDYGFELYENSPERTIKFGAKFTNKILSHGTFSWWIGVLGSQNNIIFPNREDYAKWHGDIFVFEDWHELKP
tara:strand:- start:1849 stop:2631 length:783 start_codon:yes stop_codon:yes gene_type:complete